MGKILTNNGEVDAPPRVLLVAAHPDDIDFGSSGTVACLRAAGSYVAYCLVTSGDAGDDEMRMSQTELATLRETEQTAAAAIHGVESIHWLRYPDGQVEPSLDLRRDIARVVRIETPDLVITQSPERIWESIYASHPDHLATGEATMRAVYPDARNPRAFPQLLDEGHQPHTVPEVWVGLRQPDLVVDITDTFDQKLAALRAHRSQTEQMDDLEDRLREWGLRIGEAGSLPDGRLGEGYRRIQTA